MRGANGARLPSIGVWLWGGSPDSSKFTTTASDGTFSFTHGDGTFTLIVYVIENDAYVGWYSEDSPGGFTTQRGRATVFRLNGDRLTRVEIRLPADHVQLPPAMASGTTAAVPVPDAKPAGVRPATPSPNPTRTVADPQSRLIEGTLRWPSGSGLHGARVWLWGGSPASSKVTTTSSNGWFSLTHGEGAFTLIIYIPDSETYIGWYSEDSAGGFTTQRERATVFRLDGDYVTEVDIQLPDHPLSLRAAMGSDTAAGVPIPDAKPTATTSRPTPIARPRPRPTPRPTATPAPIPLYPEIVFVGDVDPTTQADYRSAMEDVIAYFDDRYRVGALPFALYVGADLEAVRAAYREIGGSSPETLARGGLVATIGETKVVLIIGDFVAEGVINDTLLAHEYFHVVQGRLSNNTWTTNPRWLREGSAVYESMLYTGAWERYRRGALLRSANYDDGLSELEQFERAEAPHGYALGALGSEWLAQHAGRDAQLSYWRSLARSATWAAAFESAFGLAPREFYGAFEEHFERTLSELGAARISGTVLGPAGEPLRGVVVQAQGPDFYDTSSVETGRDGAFRLHVRNGVHRIKVYARDAGGLWNHVGWYGAGGFATDRGRATTIEIDGSDVGGIEVRLPATPANLPKARPPRIQGTVVGPGGEPIEGIGVWLRGESDADHKLGRTAADGTFDIEHQSGAFRIKIHIWREALWHDIGWYGEGGFTANEEEATRIEVGGEDVTGIQIRLPPRISGTVLGPDGEPVAGVFLWMRDQTTGDARFVRVSPDGTFDVLYGDGTFTLEVSAWEGEDAWRRIGWYGGASGFTTEEAQAASIEVSGADVGGIEIRLPAAPAEVRGQQVRGVVFGPDGEPVEGIGVWLLGESDGDHRLGVTAADGTFNIEYRRGAYRIRIDILRSDGWHPAGWHGEDGFTLNAEDAARIEVDDDDITGIEIRLPPRARGIVLGPGGEPLGGVGLWLWDGVLGSSSTFGGSAADGTFDLFHPGGTFLIWVYAWEGEGWRHIGWYEHDGFTTTDHRATEIELDGADVTSIEIRLHRDPVEMPTVE